MYKINLHAHSVYSDGVGTVLDMALVCRSLGFTACVITDHIYSTDSSYSSSYEKYIRQVEDAKLVSKELNYPVIIGAEVSIGRYEEVLLFGSDAIVALLKMRNKKIIRKYDPLTEHMCSIDELINLRECYNCATVLCHPCLASYDNRPNFIEASGAKALDGYERYNSASDCFGKYRDVPLEFENLVAVCDSDAHSPLCLDFCWNKTTFPITTELNLISYIKAYGSFKHIVCERHVD